MTDKSGHYRLEGLVPGTYNIWAKKENWTVKALESFEAKEGKTKKAAPLRLVRGGFIKGKVIDAISGEAIQPGEKSDE